MHEVSDFLSARICRFVQLFVMTMLIVLAAAVSPASAKDDAVSLPDVWDASAKRAEEALRNGQASTKALETLRAELAAQRAQAFGIVERGSIDTRSIKAQLDALGPAPAADTSEHQAVAARRAELEDALAAADRPVLDAKQGYRRAGVLIEAIDGVIRSRQRAELFARYPTPLLPSHWITAGSEVAAYVERLREEIAADISRPTKATTLKSRLTIAAISAILGLLVLIVLQPLLLRRAERAVENAYTAFRLRFYSAVVYLLRAFLPLIGMYLLVVGYYTLDIEANSARSFKGLVANAPLLLIAAYWLGHAFFAPNMANRRVIDVGRHAGKAVLICLALALVLIAELLLDAAERDFGFSDRARSVLATLIVAIGSYFLWRLASVLRNALGPAGEQAAAPETGVGASFLDLVARLIQVAAVAAIVTAAVGYTGLARFAMVPAIMSLGLAGFALTVYRGAVSLIEMLATGTAAGGIPGLSVFAPLVAGLVVLAASLLGLALIWGARTSDISELWLLASQGVEVGDTRISLTVILTAAAVFFAGILATRWLQRLLGHAVLPKTHLDDGARSAILTGTSYTGVTLAALLAIAAAGINLSSLAIVFGALSVGIGFGLQAITSNFISGIILLVERPIKEGDWIEVSGHSGIVKKIAVRSTRIETFDRHSVIIPNSDLITSTVTNMTLDTKIGRVIVPVGVAYGSDLETTRNILVDAAGTHELVMSDPAPAVLFMGLGENSLDFELRCFVADVGTVLSVKSDLLYAIYRALENAGVGIPFPQRDIHLGGMDRLVEAIESRKSE